MTDCKMIDFSRHATPEYYRESINNIISEMQDVDLLWLIYRVAQSHMEDERKGFKV